MEACGVVRRTTLVSIRWSTYPRVVPGTTLAPTRWKTYTGVDNLNVNKMEDAPQSNELLFQEQLDGECTPHLFLEQLYV